MVFTYEEKEDLTLVTLSIEELIPKFKTFRVGLIVAENIEIRSDRSKELEEYISNSVEKVSNELSDIEFGNIPEVESWRKTYKQFGSKKSRYRSSVERLLKAIKNGKDLPQIFNLVDVYNVTSMLWKMPIGADDFDKVVQPQAFRLAREGDTFIALGDKSKTIDPPEIGEVIYADAEKCLCRRWNWYQDARSSVSLNTNRAILTVQTIDPISAANLENAIDDLCTQLNRFCMASTKWSIADANNQLISI